MAIRDTHRGIELERALIQFINDRQSRGSSEDEIRAEIQNVVDDIFEVPKDDGR